MAQAGCHRPDPAQLSQEDEGTLARPCLPTLGRSPQGWQSRLRLQGGCPASLGAGPRRLSGSRVVGAAPELHIMRRCFTIGPAKEGPQCLAGLMASGLWMSLQAGLRGGQGEATREPLVGARMPRCFPACTARPRAKTIPGLGSRGRELRTSPRPCAAVVSV